MQAEAVASASLHKFLLSSVFSWNHLELRLIKLLIRMQAYNASCSESAFASLVSLLAYSISQPIFHSHSLLMFLANSARQWKCCMYGVPEQLQV